MLFDRDLGDEIDGRCVTGPIIDRGHVDRGVIDDGGRIHDAARIAAATFPVSRPRRGEIDASRDDERSKKYRRDV
jgi:hypothetical protein